MRIQRQDANKDISAGSEFEASLASSFEYK